MSTATSALLQLMLLDTIDIIQSQAKEIDRLRIQVRQADERGDEAMRRAHQAEATLEAAKQEAKHKNIDWAFAQKPSGGIDG